MHSLRRAQRGVAAFEAKLKVLPPTLARLTVGYAFLTTGWGKLHNLERVTEFFTSLSIPAPAFHATFVSCIEFGCGALLLLGLLTRVAAVPLIGTMVVALLTAIWPDIDGLSGLFGTIEFLYIALCVGLVVGGPGALSLDHLILRERAPAARDAAGVDLMTSTTRRSRTGSVAL
ncbi:MAG TPA: DoxX family protein [Polyangiaceae bacterium]|nr:DoxX family protein [Polyangiaceae bacterium]